MKSASLHRSGMPLAAMCFTLSGIGLNGLFCVLAISFSGEMPSDRLDVRLLAINAVSLGALLSFGTALLLSILSLTRTRRRRLSSGQVWSVCISLALSLAFFIAILAILAVKLDTEHHRRIAAAPWIGEDKMRALGYKIILYASTKDDKLPSADEWCDVLLANYSLLSPEDFAVPRKSQTPCNFAFNRHLSQASLDRIPGNVVLLFEAAGPLNSSGAAELIESSGSERRRTAMVLFVDGNIGLYEFGTGEVSECYSDDYAYSPLKWEP